MYGMPSVYRALYRTLGNTVPSNRLRTHPRGWDVAEWVNYLPHTHKALDSVPITTETGTSAAHLHPRTEEVKAGSAKRQGILSYIARLVWDT